MVMLEKELSANVVDLAHLFGWQVAHFRPAQTNKGWRTPVGADGQGYPDLTLVRDRVVYMELKVGYGKLTPHQAEWGARLLAAGAEWYELRPSDWADGTIEAILRKRTK
jgi:hypothetical protein